MASVRRFVGKTPFARALRFTTKTGHVSHYAKKKKTGFLKVPDSIKQGLDERIRLAEQNKKARKMLPRWKRMQKLASELGRYAGQKPTTTQAVAALAMEHGLSGSQLPEYANALYALNRIAKKTKHPILADRTSSPIVAADKGALPKVFNLLQQSEKPFTINQIAGRTGLPRSTVNGALISLESAKLAQQLPQETQERTGGQNYRWTSFENRLSPATKPVSNAAYRMMLALQSGEKNLAQLIRPSKKTSLKKLIGEGSMSHITASRAVRDLEDSGLVSSRAVRVHGLRTPVLFFGLSEFGKQVLQKQQSRKSISPEMRQILLRKPLVMLMPSEKTRLQRMIRDIRIRSAYEKIPKIKKVSSGTIKLLAEKFSVPEHHIGRAYTPKFAPWRNLALETIRSVYLPAMRKVAPTEAAWLGDYLQKNKGKLKRRLRKKGQVFLSPIELFKQNQGLAFYIANDYWIRNSFVFERLAMGKEDVKQHSLKALQRAAEAYLPGSKAKFSTFAFRVIRNELNTQLTKAHAKKRKAKITSLSKTVEGKKRREEPLSAIIEDKREPVKESPDLRDLLLSTIRGLGVSERNKNILIDGYGLINGKALTLKERADKYGLTRERIRQIEEIGLAKLRKHPKMQQFNL